MTRKNHTQEDWPDDDERINTIIHNGNTGEHYDEIDIDAYEEEKRERMREAQEY